MRNIKLNKHGIQQVRGRQSIYILSQTKQFHIKIVIMRLIDRVIKSQNPTIENNLY